MGTGIYGCIGRRVRGRRVRRRCVGGRRIRRWTVRGGVRRCRHGGRRAGGQRFRAFGHGLVDARAALLFRLLLHLQARIARCGGVGNLRGRVQRAATDAVGLRLRGHLVQRQIVGMEIQFDRGVQFEIGIDLLGALGAFGRHVTDGVLDLGAGAPRPHAEAAAGLDPVLHPELAALVLAGGAAGVDVEAHRRIDLAAVDHDPLHAQHHHRRELLLALTGEIAARERHQLFGVAGVDGFLRRHAQGRADFFLPRHRGAGPQPQFDVRHFFLQIGQFVRVHRLAGLRHLVGVGRVVFDRFRKVIRHPLPHLHQPELGALEPFRGRRHRVEQLQVLLHLLRVGVDHRLEHAVDQVGDEARERHRIQHVLGDACDAVGGLAEVRLRVLRARQRRRRARFGAAFDLALGLAFLGDEFGRERRHLHHRLRQRLALRRRQRAVVRRAFQHVAHRDPDPRRRRGRCRRRCGRHGARGRHGQATIGSAACIIAGIGSADEAGSDASQRCAATMTSTSSGLAASRRIALSA